MFERLGRRLVGSVLIWDLLLTLVALHSTMILRVLLQYGNEITQQQVKVPLQLYFLVAVIWAITFLLLTPQRALFFRTLIEAIGRLLAAVALAALTFAGVLYLSFRDISRLQFVYFVILDLAGLLIFHLIIRFSFHTRNHHSKQRRILIVGSATEATQLVDAFESRSWMGLDIIGIATNDPVSRDDIQALGSVDATAQIVAEQQVDEVVFVTPDQETIARLSLQLVHLPVMLHMVPSVLDLTFARTPVESLGGIPLISLRESALTDAQRILKRVFDIVGSTLLLVLLSPLMLLITILVKLESPGPVFFKQERIGEHGRHFKMIKFRSMYQDAEHRWHEVAERDMSGRLLHKRDDDPRVTKIGAKLRRTSLDELPQLINVLLGEMSLVGPRPEMPYIAREYEPWQWQRFRIPPGMTGWWQVNGRSSKLMHLHTEDDLYYTQNYSFWLDLKILWRTVGVVLKGRGAF